MALYLGNTKVKVKSGLARYTVVGSPTIVNGIASNFSASNYLQLQQPVILNEDSIIEFKTKINLSTISTNNGIIGYPNGYYFHLIIVSDNKIDLFMGNGSSWTLLNGQKGTTVLSANTDYYIKIIINKGNVKCLLSTDDITYTTEFDVDITITEEYNYNIVYGRSRADSQYLHGSMDLNETYIKINDNYFFRGSKQDILGYKVKYDNLFNGYYIIEDGKLKWANPNIYLQSSSDNYGGDGVNAKQWINTNYIPSQGIEYEIDFTLFTSETSANNSYIMGTNCFGLEGHWNNNSNNALIYFNDNYTFTMTRNERHNVAIKKQNDNYNFYLDNVLQTTFTELTIAPTRKMYLFALNAYDSGRAAYASYSRIYKYKIWDNGTLIYHFVPVPKGLLIGNFVVPSNGMFDIVEQKFYGNQGTGDFTIGGIPEDYIIDNGKLIWCRDDIYLESTGTQYIDTGVLTSSDLIIDIEYYRESGYLFGYLGTIDSVNKSYGYTSSSSNGYMRIGNWYAYNNTAWSDNKWLKLHVEKDNTKANIDGTLFTSFSTGTSTDFNNGQNITLFRYNNAGGSDLVGKIKTFQIYQNSQILQYLVPVPKGMLIGNKIAPSNCMFDIVTQTFFENQGTGEFVYGGLGKDLINVGNNIVWTDENVYLKCNGAQYFDSGFKANQDTKVDVDYTPYDSGVMTVYCCRDGLKVNTFTCFSPVSGTSSTRYDYNTSQNTIASNPVAGTRRHIVADKNKFYIDDVLKYTATYANFQSTNSMIFGCSNANGYDNYSKFKYHKIQLFDNSKLIRYFLPVDTDTVIGSFIVPSAGMWDAVTRKFYPNKGTGSFTYGKDS